MILEIKDLHKTFGSKEVVKNLNFEVKENTIYGFLGQNGAGKTTCMKMILGLEKPTSGTIKVCGETVTYGETKTNRHIGYLPDVPEYYNFMRPKEYLALCGEVTGLSKPKIKEKTSELLKLVGLENENKKIGGFSRGMKQRLGIAQALLNEPKLLICDEPTSALDPIGRKEILDILLSVKGKTTIVFSTHILSDVERICDEVGILHNGSIQLTGTLEDLKKQHSVDKIRVVFNSNKDMLNFIENSKFNFEEDNSKTLTISSENLDLTQEKLFKKFAELGIYPSLVEALEPTLESLFLEVVK